MFAQLKAMPEVAGANLREAAYAQFKEMIDRSVGIMITVNLVFAWIIAFGLVYNGARIALSERGYELATLRVLGFTQRESASLLLGEQGVITGVGLPLGLALGIALTLYFIWMLSTRDVAHALRGDGRQPRRGDGGGRGSRRRLRRRRWPGACGAWTWSRP